MVHLPTASFWSWLTGESKKDDDAPPAKPVDNNEKSDEDQPSVSKIAPGGGEDAPLGSADSSEGREGKNEGADDVLTEEVPSATIGSTDGIPEEVSSKADGLEEKAAGASPRELSTKATGSTDDLEKEADEIPSEEVYPEATESADGIGEKADGVSPDEAPTKAEDSIDDGLNVKADDVLADENSAEAGGKADDVPAEISTESTISTGGLDETAGDASPEEMSAQTIDSSDGLDEAHVDIPLEKVSSETELTDGLVEKDDDIPSNRRGFASLFQTGHDGTEISDPIVLDETEGSVPPEEVIRTGYIKYIDFSKKYGIIVPDEDFRNIDPIERANALFLFSEICPEIKEFVSFDDNDLLTPTILPKQRVQFQATVHKKKGKRGLQAFYVRCVPPFLSRTVLTEKGGIPMLNWQAASTLIRKANARLGNELYKFFSSREYIEEMKLKRMHAALDRCDKKVTWMRDQVVTKDVVAMECKAKLGEEIYDLLSNIATVDDVERRADMAYFRCLGNLWLLGIKLTPNQEEDLKGWMRRRI